MRGCLVASDVRGLRDLTLWETNDGGAVNFHMVRQARPCRGVPAVLRITVAEIEESKAECREALERMERAVRDRDEARGERDEARAKVEALRDAEGEAYHAGLRAATRERDEARADECDRYREALAEGKLTAHMFAPRGFSDEKREAWDFAVYEAEQFIARALREASLGGGDDCLDPEQAFGAVQSGPDEADD